MNLIEIFNIGLNQSVKKQSRNWDNYRQVIDSEIKKIVKKLNSHDTAIVLAAGNCDDFSLPFLFENFRKVVATDIDVSGLNERMKTEYKEYNNLDLIRVEFTGLEKNRFFEDFEQRVFNCESFDCIKKFIDSRLDTLDNYKFLKNYEEQGDLVVVLPIYPQLVYGQVLNICSRLRQVGYPEDRIKYVEVYMLEKMVPLIDRFNDNVFNITKEDGYILSVSDIFQTDNKSEFHKRVEQCIDSNSEMEELYQEYLNQYGYGLGDYGLLSLGDRTMEMEYKWAIWPFNESSSFIVKLAIYKRNYLYNIKGGVNT